MANHLPYYYKPKIGDAYSSTAIRKPNFMKVLCKDEKQIKGIPKVAYCTSGACNRNFSYIPAHGRVKSNASIGESLCPDCGHALIWKDR